MSRCLWGYLFVGKEFPQECFSEHSEGNDENQMLHT